MKINLGKETLLYPMPVLIIGSYDENGNADAMNAAWGGIYDYNQVFLSLSAGHKTVKNILKTGALTVAPADKKHIKEADYFGLVSGNDVEDKIAKAGLTVTKSEFVNAPVINEFPFVLECTLASYNPDTGSMVADIVNISADESIMTNGKVSPEKLNPLCFDGSGSAYYVLGEKVGNAFSDGNEIK